MLWAEGLRVPRGHRAQGVVRSGVLVGARSRCTGVSWGSRALVLLRDYVPICQTTKGAMDLVTCEVTSERVAPLSSLPCQ